MDSTETFFTKLKKIRESKEINIKEIAESTKINTKFLSAIESGNFDILPAVYMRLFIRSYCEFLEIDPKKVLDDYEIFTVGSIKNKSINIPEAKNTFDEILDEESIEIGQISKSRIIKIAITLVVIITFFWFISSITNNDDSTPVEENLEQSIEILPKENEIIDELSETVQEIIPTLIQEQQNPSNSILDPYHENNLIEVFSTELPLSGELTLSIQTLKKTKIDVSWNNYTKSFSESVGANKTIYFPFEENINFDLENVSDVKCSLNDITIDSYLMNNGEYLIRGSYEPQTANKKSKLFISFYKNNS